MTTLPGITDFILDPASVFPFDGSTTGVAVADQLTGEIDVWQPPVS